jgi:bacterioferritin (cytochrome b1)
MHDQKIHNRLVRLEGVARIATADDLKIEADAAAFMQRISELATRMRLNPNFTESIAVGPKVPADYISAEAFTHAISRTARHA